MIVTRVNDYECVNYSSITEGEGYIQMSDCIAKELKMGKICICTSKPKCIHALGASFKADGIITDCKRPLHRSINNTMQTACYAFSYSNIDDVCTFLEKDDYLCVVDIDNAYRSITYICLTFLFRHSHGLIRKEKRLSTRTTTSASELNQPRIFSLSHSGG